MKKLFAFLTLAGLLTFGAASSFGQETTDSPDSANMADAAADSGAMDSGSMADDKPAMEEEAKEDMAAEEPASTEPAESGGYHQVIKDKFIEGGPAFMSLVLICLILGLAFCIERILYLNLATTNTTKLLASVEDALQSGGVDAAKEVCRNTRGPVASIFYQGLERAGEGAEAVEKAVISYGSVQMGLMEKGISWISLFIALAPMLGFFGTVIGMIQAFDAIAAQNNISHGIVAGGIGVALITTVSGLSVAMILQVFYNYIMAKVDSIVNDMENASISLVDLVIRHNARN
ncbi:MAG: MotA/TolQ/ExbB proton channel family protein [Salibacteraceae bacterium]